jgi:hypothetical protein
MKWRSLQASHLIHFLAPRWGVKNHFNTLVISFVQPQYLQVYLILINNS